MRHVPTAVRVESSISRDAMMEPTGHRPSVLSDLPAGAFLRPRFQQANRRTHGRIHRRMMIRFVIGVVQLHKITTLR